MKLTEHIKSAKDHLHPAVFHRSNWPSWSLCFSAWSLVSASEVCSPLFSLSHFFRLQLLFLPSSVKRALLASAVVSQELKWKQLQWVHCRRRCFVLISRSQPGLISANLECTNHFNSRPSSLVQNNAFGSIWAKRRRKKGGGGKTAVVQACLRPDKEIPAPPPLLRLTSSHSWNTVFYSRKKRTKMKMSECLLYHLVYLLCNSMLVCFCILCFLLSLLL